MSGLAETLGTSWRLLWELPGWSVIALFWLTFVAELPRYFLGVQATAAMLLFRERRRHGPIGPLPRVSILLAGHNEEDAIEKCVRSLRQQTFNDFEIICVDDGSTDATFEIMKRLRREGLVEAAIRLDLRGSKPSALNLAASVARGDVFVVVDCDCSFEPNAIEELLRPLAEDPALAGVAGNILVRNWRKSIVSSLQGIEYLVSISLGKAYADVLGQVACISGAFGAFRRRPWMRVHGMDTGGGEDFDFTVRLRMAGYKVAFARHSICYTDVPDTLYALLRQRHRWERDTFWVRMRKYKRLFNPFRQGFRWTETLHQWDFVLFNLLPTVVFPFYVTWLVTTYGGFGIVLLGSVSIFLLSFDVLFFCCALLVSGHFRYWRLLAFVPLFGPFQSYLMRLDRLYAFATEWIFSRSLRDNYTPQKIRDWATWK